MTKAVSTGDGSYDSPEVTVNNAGSYWWVASFKSSSPSVTDAAPTQCNDPLEKETIKKAEPAISTEVSKGEITVGENVPNDTAHLSGLVKPSGTRSITFTFYDNSTCEGTAFAETSVSVNDNGNYSTNLGAIPTEAVGTYFWAANYSGDANNTTAKTGCSDATEQVKVKKATPELITNATATATVGQSISDVATLSKLVKATGAGAVTFDLYKGVDCSPGNKVASALTATPASVTGNGPYTSQSFDTTNSGAGPYHWIAHYSGDANNNAVSGACFDNGENTTVEKANPQLTTNATATATVGQSISDRRDALQTGQSDRRRCGHLRPLQGRRLLAGQQSRLGADRDPGLGDRQRPLHLPEL